MKPTSEFDEYDPRFDAVLENVFQAIQPHGDVVGHVDELEMTDYAYDRLNAQESERVRRHIESCPACAHDLQETEEIRSLIQAAKRERDWSQQVAVRYTGRPAWRLAGAALAMACLALLAVFYGHLMQVNRSLSQSAPARQKAIDGLQRQLAQKSATDALVGTQQRQLDQRGRQVALARLESQHLQAQLNALKQQDDKRHTDLVAQRSDKRHTDLIAQRSDKQPSKSHSITGFRYFKVARRTPFRRSVNSVNYAVAASVIEHDVQVALAEKRLPLSEEYQANMIGSGGLEMGEGGARSTFSVLSPVGTNLLSASPLFTWTPVEHATGYEVVVQDQKGQVVADSHLLPGAGTAQWQSSVTLPRDQLLHWSVTAINADAPSLVAPDKFQPVALFTILGEAKAEAIRRQTASVADSPKALAVLYAKENLLDDAEREAQAWEMTNPESAVARAWLTGLRTYRSGSAVDGGKQPNE